MKETKDQLMTMNRMLFEKGINKQDFINTIKRRDGSLLVFQLELLGCRNEEEVRIFMDREIEKMKGTIYGY